MADHTGFEPTLDAIRAWCVRRGIETMFNAELGQLAILRDGHRVPIRVVPRPEHGVVTLAAILPGSLPEARYDELAKAIALINAYAFGGAWVLAPSSGELYYAVSLPVAGLSIDDDAFATLVGQVAEAYDRASHALDEVARGRPAASLLPPPARA